MGLLGMIVAMLASLRDESTMFAEYEALGIRPSVLARSNALRLAALSMIGLVAGIGGGLVAVRLIGALVAVTGSGAVPIPPIETVVDWRATTALILTIGLASVAAAFLLTGRAFSRPVAERLRA
jgi:ABC-type antimicrobial peptide transport system permease subunit